MVKLEDFPKYQDALLKILRDINKEKSTALSDTKKVNEYIDRLKKVYEPGFRHRYSPLYNIILEVAGNGKTEIEPFQTKLQTILRAWAKVDSDAAVPFFKLCDHLDLDGAVAECGVF